MLSKADEAVKSGLSWGEKRVAKLDPLLIFTFLLLIILGGWRIEERGGEL